MKTYDTLLKLLENAPSGEDRDFINQNYKVWEIIHKTPSLRKLVQDGNIPRAYQLLRNYIGRDLSVRPLWYEQDHSNFIAGLKRTQAAWIRPFVGDLDNIFHAAVVREAENFDDPQDNDQYDDYYAKMLPVVQSSGAGKSRLLDHYSSNHLGVIYTFRKDQQTGYPPGDPEILRLLHRTILVNTDTTSSLVHAAAVGLIGSTISELISQLEATPEESRQDFPKLFHDKMAPAQHAPIYIPSENDSENYSSYISSTRSSYRKLFCKTTTAASKTIMKKLMEDEDWTSIFIGHDASAGEIYEKKYPFYLDMARNQIVIQVLMKPLEKLLALLLSCGITEAKDPIQMFITLDEASNLVFSESEQPTILIAFRRVMGLLRSYPIWAFVLSTQRPTMKTNTKNCSRIDTAVCERLTPFVSFFSDLGLNNSTTQGTDIRSKTLADYSSVQHLCALGRPLWMGYCDVKAVDTRSFVKTKLFCGAHFNPDNDAMLFAVLSHRLALDPLINRFRSAPLEEQAVGYHLRWMVQAHEQYGYIETMTLEEPIISEAAAAAFCTGNVQENDPWILTIQNLYTNICRSGLINRGRTGELIWRIYSIIAKDVLCRTPGVIKPSGQGGKHLKYARPFSFVRYIETLFAKSSVILDTPAKVKKTRLDRGQDVKDGSSKSTIRSVLGNAVCNFNHYVSTDKVLYEDAMNDLLHQLLFSQAALVLALKQPIWDALIPIYHGDIEKPFDPSLIAVFLIRINTNEDRKTHLNVDKHRTSYEELFGNRMVVSVLVDLGRSKAKCKAEPSYKPTTWAYRVTGRGPKTYCGLPKELENVMEKIFQNDVEHAGLETGVSDYNRHFNHHGWEERLNIPRITETASDIGTTTKKRSHPETTDKGNERDRNMSTQKKLKTRDSIRKLKGTRSTQKAKKISKD